MAITNASYVTAISMTAARARSATQEVISRYATTIGHISLLGSHRHGFRLLSVFNISS
jgi:hypothetical protein